MHDSGNLTPEQMYNIGYQIGSGLQANMTGKFLGNLPFCFPPGTLVLMADGGTKRIEDVRAGDLVWAAEPEGGDAGARFVTGTMRNWTERLVHVRLDRDGDGEFDGELVATGRHPLWTENRGWRCSEDLQPGDLLRDESGNGIAVAGVWSEEVRSDTYNLSIDGTHTYFVVVNGTPVLVHNANPYSVGFEAELNPSSYPGGSRDWHFQQGNEALLQAMEGDPALAKKMQRMGVNLNRTPTGLAPRRPPAGWSWHHPEDRVGKIQLVPLAQHKPGSAWQGVLHPGPNGGGGYAKWCK